MDLVCWFRCGCTCICYFYNFIYFQEWVETWLLYKQVVFPPPSTAPAPSATSPILQVVSVQTPSKPSLEKVRCTLPTMYSMVWEAGLLMPCLLSLSLSLSFTYFYQHLYLTVKGLCSLVQTWPSIFNSYQF